MKRPLKFLLIMLLLLAIVWLAKQYDWRQALNNIFRSKQIEIEQTAIVVKEINALAQIVTITAYNEVVMDKIIKGNNLFNNPIIPSLLNVPNLSYADKKLVLIGKGRVFAGIDLANITDKDIFIKGDSIAIHLPAAKILQVIINPTDFDYFEETGNWTDEEVRAVKVKLREKLIATVLKQNLPEKATAKAKLIMENFITAVGFKKVTIIFN